MRVITTDLLNRFWKNGIKPIMNAIESKFDTSKIINNLLTTEAGYALDARQGKVVQDQIDEINSNLSELNTGTGGIILSYADGNYYAQYGEDASSKKVLGEISRLELINALANAGLGLTHDSTPEQIYAALATKYPPNKSLLMAGWTKTGSLPTTQSCSSTMVKITFTTGSGISQGQAGYCYYTSPSFDISSFRLIELIGISYRVAGQTGYSPYVQLVSSAGNAITIYNQTSAGVGENKQSNINASYNMSSLSGIYYLRITIPSYNENGHYYNVGAYVSLTKALLSA